MFPFKQLNTGTRGPSWMYSIFSSILRVECRLHPNSCWPECLICIRIIVIECLCYKLERAGMLRCGPSSQLFKIYCTYFQAHPHILAIRALSWKISTIFITYANAFLLVTIVIHWIYYNVYILHCASAHTPGHTLAQNTRVWIIIIAYRIPNTHSYTQRYPIPAWATRSACCKATHSRNAVHNTSKQTWMHTYLSRSPIQSSLLQSCSCFFFLFSC